MKTYHVAYTTYNYPSVIETEEIDFEDNIPINQNTIFREIESIHSSWNDGVSVRQVISWSEVQNN